MTMSLLELLIAAKNLWGSKINIEKSVPKNYEEAFKKFKEESFKIRNMPGLEQQVQIIFDGHLMLLRTKIKDTLSEKYHYTIHSTFEPPMDTEASIEKSSLKVPAGTRPSPKLNAELLSKINSSTFMSIKGLQEDITDDSLKKNILDYLKDEHRRKVKDIQVSKKGLAVIFCESWETASVISNSYKDKFMDCNVSFTLFAEKRPDQSTN